MIPPPITSIRFGMPPSSSAPVESTSRGSSYGKPGMRATEEPAAMMQCSNAMRFWPSGVCTSIVFGDSNLPTPCTTVTLRCLARLTRPFVSLPTTDSFQPRSLSTSNFGAPNAMPWWLISSTSVTTLAACSSAFDGMQPTLRQTPPSDA